MNTKPSWSRPLAVLAIASAQAILPIAYAASPSPVKIGVLTDISGVFSDLGGKGSVVAAQMAIEDFKKSAKPAFDIQLVFADHQNKPDIGAARAREWYDTQGVTAIFDAINSAVALSVSNVARAKQKLLFATGPGTMRLTNEDCSPYTVSYTWDTYSTSRPQAIEATKNGARNWYFLTVDYALGRSIEEVAIAAITSAGGKVVRSAKHPLGAADFSSYVVAAQGAGADALALASAGEDMHKIIKTAREFGVTKSMKLVPLAASITDVHALGLNAAQGMVLTEGFYWNLNQTTREWSRRFFERQQRMPNLVQAGTYSAVMNYLKVVQQVGSTSSSDVIAAMKKTPINDVFASGGRIREDGRMVHDMYLVEVKAPAESKEPWDYYKIKRVIPADQAFQPLNESRCPLVK